MLLNARDLSGQPRWHKRMYPEKMIKGKCTCTASKSEKRDEQHSISGYTPFQCSANKYACHLPAMRQHTYQA